MHVHSRPKGQSNLSEIRKITTSHAAKTCWKDEQNWDGLLQNNTEIWLKSLRLKVTFFKDIYIKMSFNMLFYLKSEKASLLSPFSYPNRIRGISEDTALVLWALTGLTCSATASYTHINTFTISSDDQQLLTEILFGLWHDFLRQRAYSKKLTVRHTMWQKHT